MYRYVSMSCTVGYDWFHKPAAPFLSLFTDMHQLHGRKYWSFLSFSFSFHPTVGLFSKYEMKCFSCNQLPYLPLFYVSSRIGSFLVIVFAFWKNLPCNCRCNALSASLEVIMRSVCFCEDNRESQGILSHFPDGSGGGVVEHVCLY